MRRNLLALFATLAVASIPILADATPPPRWSGLLLRRALDELRSMGLDIIYSSDLVRPSMWVAAEPRSADLRGTLDEMLEPHGLAADEGPGGRLLIVRAPPRGSISGVVIDAREGRPLAGASLHVAGAHVRAVTDEEGRFEASGIPPGTYTVVASFPSHETRTLEAVLVDPGGATGVRIEMEPSIVSSEAVVVFAEGVPPRGDGPAHRESPLGAEGPPGPSIAADPLFSLGSLPGVHHADASAGLHVRGGATDETLVLLDGMELYTPFHLKERQGLFSIVDGESVERLSVLGVGFPAEYGGRMSGVIDATSADPASLPAASLSAGSEGARAAASGAVPFGGGRWLLSARAGFPDESIEATGAAEGHHHSFYDLFGKAVFDAGARSALTFSFLGAVDDPGGAPGDPVPEDDEGAAGPFRTSSGYAWATLGTAWSARLHSRTILSAGSLSDMRIDRGGEHRRLEETRSVDLVGLKQDWALDGRRHLVKWGVDLKHFAGDYRYGGAGEDREDDEEEDEDPGSGGSTTAAALPDSLVDPLSATGTYPPASLPHSDPVGGSSLAIGVDPTAALAASADPLGDPALVAGAYATATAANTLSDPLGDPSLGIGAYSAGLSGTDVALYVSDVIRLTPGLELEAGLRWGRVSWAEPSGAMIDPRIALAWRTGRRSLVRTGWGIYHQPGRIGDVDLQSGLEGTQVVQRSEHRFVAFDHDTARGLHLGAMIYDKRTTEVEPRYAILHDPHGLHSGAGDDLVPIEPLEARARGVEIVLGDNRFERLAWWAAGGAASAEERLAGDWVPRAWDQRYTIGWGVEARPRPEWRVALSGSHHSGHPSAPLDAEIATDPAGRQEIRVRPANDGSPRFAPYHRLDLRLGRTFTAGASEVEVFAGVANLLGRDNVCCAAGSGFELLENGSVEADSGAAPGLSRLSFYGLRWRR